MPADAASDKPCTCAALRRATRALTAAYDAALAPSGLRITQFAVLRTLSRLGPLAVSRLAAEAELDRSTMGRNLDLLQKRELVAIASGERDGRERVATITAAGRSAIDAALPHWRDVQRRAAELVDPALIGALSERLGSLPRA